MKALNTGKVPTGIWQCEIKFDGYRAVAVVNQGSIELWSRNHKPMDADFPELVAELGKLKCRNAVLDGEIVALDAAGRSRFQLLQGRGLPGERPSIVYYVFDIMFRDGKSLTDLPLTERRKHLKAVAGMLSRWVQLSPEFQVEPAQLLVEARKNHLEGIIAKIPDSTYESDRRSGAWIKCKILAEQEFVIGGFTEPQNSREYFGALLVGFYQGGKFLYAGKVGTGFDRELLSSLHQKFSAHRVETCPFENLPMTRRSRYGTGMGWAEMKKVNWIKPVYVAELKFAEWTEDGLLRQPVFLGLREDKAPKDVHREMGPIGSAKPKKTAAK